MHIIRNAAKTAHKLTFNLNVSGTAIITPIKQEDNWDPREIAGLVAWYDATNAASVFEDTGGTTPASNGSPVARWDDLSGNGHHMLQVTLAKRPIYRTAGGGAIVGDTTDDTMEPGTPTPNKADGSHQLLAVLEIGAGSTAVTNNQFVMGVHAGEAQGRGPFLNGVGGIQGWYAGQATPDPVFPPIAVGDKMVVSADYAEGSGDRPTRIGKDLARRPTPLVRNWTDRPNLEIWGSAHGWRATEVLVKEALMYDAPISDEDYQRLVNWLRSKHGYE